MGYRKKMETQICTSSVGNDMKYMIDWFENWTASQRMMFLEPVVAKIVPDKLFARALRLTMNSSRDRFPNDPTQCKLFDEQLLYSLNCLDKWNADDSNRFLTLLEEIDRIALYHFYDMIAATVGEL